MDALIALWRRLSAYDRCVHPNVLRLLCKFLCYSLFTALISNLNNRKCAFIQLRLCCRIEASICQAKNWLSLRDLLRIRLIWLRFEWITDLRFLITAYKLDVDSATKQRTNELFSCNSSNQEIVVLKAKYEDIVPASSCVTCCLLVLVIPIFITHIARVPSFRIFIHYYSYGNCILAIGYSIKTVYKEWLTEDFYVSTMATLCNFIAKIVAGQM